VPRRGGRKPVSSLKRVVLAKRATGTKPVFVAARRLGLLT
jgi:hypothetical protein